MNSNPLQDKLASLISTGSTILQKLIQEEDKDKEVNETKEKLEKNQNISSERMSFDERKTLLELLNELNEYLESGEIEELADLEEVLRAILDIKGCSYDKFESIRKQKAEKRGAFKEKIFLESTEDNI